ncbi:Alpha-2-macroglobulin, partial [Stegodyphus mimosarum]
MVVMTDLTLETRQCTVKRIPHLRRISHHIFYFSSYYDSPEEENIDYFMGPSPRVPEKTIEEIDLMEFLEEVDTPKLIPKSTEEIRNYFPETWLWEMHTIESSGEKTLKRQLPDTITEWTGEAVCINSKTGIGFSEKSGITAFQPFFISLQLPYSVIRKEMVPIIVSVFNYLKECLPIKISLEPSEDYKVLNEYSSHKMCVCGGKSETHRFITRPLSLGQVNITVYGFSVDGDDEVCGNEVIANISARDAVTKQLLVEAEGFPKEEVL